jgi:tRNA threonylcarbamoyladenosine biosynthesis protein TsaE
MILRQIDNHHLEIQIDSEAETDQLGQALARVVRPDVVIGLVGTLGAGKTRLVRAIAESLGVDPRAIASPTFVLIHEYPGPIPIYHFDAYRLTDPEAFDALGAAEYWTEGQGLCLIEWADLVADRLPGSTWWVRIEQFGPTGRVVKVESPEVEAIIAILDLSGGLGPPRIEDGGPSPPDAD